MPLRLWRSKKNRASNTVNNYYNYYASVHSPYCTPVTAIQALPPSRWGDTNTPRGNILGLTPPSPAVNIMPMPNLGVINSPAPPVVPQLAIPSYDGSCVPRTPVLPWTPATTPCPVLQNFTPVAQCTVLDPLFTPSSTPFPCHPHASPFCSCPKNRRRRSTSSPVDVMLPTKKRPLHRNLIDIDWDLRQPLSKATCWARATGRPTDLDKGAKATISRIQEIEMIAVIEDDSAMEDGISGAIDALFNSSWGGALVAEARNGPLTVGSVLRVLRHFLYDELRPDELHYLYHLGLYQHLLDANTDRVGVVGQGFSRGDAGKFRRIDLFGEFTRFKGLEVEADEGDLLMVKCLLGTV